MNTQPLFVTGYLPELDLLRDKHDGGVRRMREDCAVLSVEHDFRPIAYRFAHRSSGHTAASWLTADSKKRGLLLDALKRGVGPLILSGKDDCVLVFCGLLEATGTVFAVRAPFSAVSVLRALRLCDRDGVLLGAAASCDVRNAALHDELISWLEEILFYTDRMLGDTSLCAMTRACLMSEFLGCRADHFALPSSPLPIAQTDDLRLSAFLLCVFLSLRACDGRLSASLAPPESEALPLTCRVHLNERLSNTSGRLRISKNELPFLSLPAFRNIRLLQTQDGLTLEATFPVCRREKDKTPLLHSLVEESLSLCIELALDNSVEN